MNKRILIVDSHKGTAKMPSNLHTVNAKIIADKVGADLIWSYPTVNDNIKSDYDSIVFNHASQYAYTDYAWVEQSPNAKLYFITNEFNLGESRTLWISIKRAGRKYEVIANHEPKPSKIVTKYTTAWHIVNLNALVFKELNLSDVDKDGCIYYGSYRKKREDYFKKWLNHVIVSTHISNRAKFLALGVEPDFINRVDWTKDGLSKFKTSLYIEDTVTHTYYNHLANRFYESLNYNVIPLFDKSCKHTVDLSGYDITEDYFVDNPAELLLKTDNLPEDYKEKLANWKIKALYEKHEALDKIVNIITQ